MCLDLSGTFWQNVVPRGTVSATRWTFITSSAVPHREGTHTHAHFHTQTPVYSQTCILGNFLWLAQSRKDLFCVWDRDGELRPSSVPLLPEVRHVCSVSSVCYAHLRTRRFMFYLCVQVELFQLSACRDALWGLDTHGRITIRTLSPSCPTGLHWTPLDLSQLGTYRSLKGQCCNTMTRPPTLNVLQHT